MKIAIVGAGFSGAVLARKLAEAGIEIDVFDSRDHVAGNCHTERDPETDIMVHKYGPHIFHTSSTEVWEYVNSFGRFEAYRHQVKTVHENQIFSMPINLHTINQFFKTNWSPAMASQMIDGLALRGADEIISFEDQALAFMGEDLYQAFFKNYTEKQWGISPQNLPASILKRLPMRFNYNDNYFSHQYQGIPVDGYTAIIMRMLSHPLVTVTLQQSVDRTIAGDYEHVFFSGPLDSWFDFEFGNLGYRTLDFKREIHDGDFQGCAVVNYADANVPYTRISEHKHFAPWEHHDLTVIYKEYSRFCDDNDIPYYPIRLVDEKQSLKNYVRKAQQEKNVTFVGRLGTYRYIDMDVAIKEALEISRKFLTFTQQNKKIPAFFIDPI